MRRDPNGLSLNHNIINSDFRIFGNLFLVKTKNVLLSKLAKCMSHNGARDWTSPSLNTPPMYKQTNAIVRWVKGRRRRRRSGGRRYHGKAGKEGRCPTGSLELGPAQVQLPPGERLQGVLVQTHLNAPPSSYSRRSRTSGDDVVSPNTRPTTSLAGRVALTNKRNSK